MRGCQEVCDGYGRPAYATGAAGKSRVMVSEEPAVDYRSYVEHFRDDLNYLAWLYHMNNGVYMTPGDGEIPLAGYLSVASGLAGDPAWGKEAAFEDMCRSLGLPVLPGPRTGSRQGPR